MPKIRKLFEKRIRNNIILKYCREVSEYFGKLVTVSAYFREVSAYIREEISACFRLETRFSRNAKQVSKNLGPLWQPGV